MHLGLWIVIGLSANAVVGAAVLAAIDSTDQKLLRWYESAPPQFGGLLEFGVLQCWPAIVWLWVQRR